MSACRKEIIEVGVLEYSYERHMQLIQDESYDNGEKNGIKSTNELYSWLNSNGRQTDVLRAIDDPDYLAQLFTEYEEWKKSNNPNS